jgi:hypothetical protein
MGTFSSWGHPLCALFRHVSERFRFALTVREQSLDLTLPPGLHVHDALPLPGALAGGRQVVSSIARLDRFRRRLGMAPGKEAAGQIEALDRLARQDQRASGSLLQFVERCTLITYASSARVGNPGTVLSGQFRRWGWMWRKVPGRVYWGLSRGTWTFLIAVAYLLGLSLMFAT